MHVLVQAFYFSISTMIMNVHVHGARCPNVLVCSSILFAGRRVGDVTDDPRNVKEVVDSKDSDL